jgi:hypothetical protein
MNVKYKVAIRWLKGQGVVLSEGKKHTKAQLGDRITTIPRHSEINEITWENIKKQLALK